jgi:glycine betaine/proline transport system substrate-binding protein
MAEMESSDNEKVAVEKWLTEHVELEAQMRSFLKTEDH